MSRIRLNYFPFTLNFRHPFSIAAGTRTGTPVVYVELHYEDCIGYGEAALPPYLPDTQETAMSFLKKADFTQFDDPLKTDTILDYIDALAEKNYPAKAAIDMAVFDLAGKISNVPVYKMIGVKNDPVPLNCYTIGMDRPELIREKMEEAKDFQLLKVKLGGENDRQLIEAIRTLTDKKICVDANQGWKNKEHAIGMIHFLESMSVLFVEQPLPKAQLEASAWLKEESPLPIIADESFQTIEDFSKIKDAFHGINVKLMKCGGIRAAKRIMEKTRDENMAVLLGCMSESSCGVSAAAQLSSLAAWTDLDGPLLITNDPFEGITYSSGKIVLNSLPGNGVKKNLP